MIGPYTRNKYPDAVEPSKVGSYPIESFSGGGYFYDDVLEYRVWVGDGKESACHSFATYRDASGFGKATEGAEEPLVLVRQNEYVAEPEPGKYRHVKEVRLAEWQVDWLKGNKDTASQIPKFLEANTSN